MIFGIDLRGLLFGLIAAILAVFGLGCAGSRAVNTTQLADYATRGESHVTYTVVPGSIAGMPNNVVAIPTVPGKDVEFRSYYADGTPQWSLSTKRSAVLDMLLSGVSEIDAAKFAEDASQRQWTMELIDRALAVAQPFLVKLSEPKPASGGGSSGNDLRSELSGIIKAVIQDELNKRGIVVPTTTQPIR